MALFIRCAHWISDLGQHELAGLTTDTAQQQTYQRHSLFPSRNANKCFILRVRQLVSVDLPGLDVAFAEDVASFSFSSSCLSLYMLLLAPCLICVGEHTA
jgi:hypothetical protein